LARTALNIPPPRSALARRGRDYRSDFGPRFIVTVDTEEEFDWSAPVQRAGFGLESVPALEKFQLFCEGYAVRPIYLTDYPVIASDAGRDLLGAFAREQRADVGLQLHPWVNPPFAEEVTQHNSFAGNLPRALERDKLMRLRDAIGEATGAQPLIYRAGRYGVGAETAGLLIEAGIRIDTSVRANFSYADEDGPDFSRHPLEPYWIDREAKLLELPLTTVYWGMLRRQGRALYPAMARIPKALSILSHSAMLERIALTPEGISAGEAIRGIDMALDDGLPVMVFSFHSPSLRPGHTPYVRDDTDLDLFYDWWRRIFAYLALRDIRPATLAETMQAFGL